MLTRKSRYRNARPFAPTVDGAAPFPGLRAREIGPATPVLEHEIQAGERLDRLALHYYNDDRLWWRIVDANPDLIAGLDAFDARDVGRTILIPKAAE